MQHNKHNHKKNIIVRGNLIGNEAHRDFLELQAAYAIEKCGGSFLRGLTEKHAYGLVNDLNLLSGSETHELIFSHYFFNNVS